MEKGMLRLSKRIFILILCACLVSGSVVQRYKITVNASSIVLGGVTYSIGEVLAWLGITVAGITGTAYVASDDYSKLIELGYEAAKAMDAELDNAQDWLFATMDKDGKAYFYANNYFDAIQSCDIASIIETTGELSNDFAIFATDTLWDIVVDYATVLESKFATGEENIVMDVLEGDYSGYSGDFANSIGQYIPYGYIESPRYDSSGEKVAFCREVILEGNISSGPIAGFVSGLDSSGYSTAVIHIYSVNGTVSPFSVNRKSYSFVYSDGNEYSGTTITHTLFSGYSYPSEVKMHFNFPVFDSEEAMNNYFSTGADTACINVSKTYQIADWSDSPQHGDFQDVITRNPALVDDYVTGMMNAFDVSVDEQIAAGEYPDVIDGSISAIPFDKPDVITPSYVGELDVPWAPDLPSVAFPDIADTDLPWSNVWTDADAGDVDIPSTDNPSSEEEPPSDEEIRGKDPSGIQLLFGTLFDLIMILLMLLMIFLSCLAFIVMIFRIEPTTGFLPEEMVAGFEYLKSLQIPGFGMSVYDFFMALIYMILIFTVIGILRKNIDKLKFPRKGKW